MDKYQFEKLTSKNFNEWCLMIEVALDRKKLGKYLTVDVPPQDAEELLSYKQARAIIISNISSDALQMLDVAQKSPAQIINTAKKLFCKPSIVGHLLLLKKLINTKGSVGNLQIYYTEMITLFNQLRSEGLAIPEKYQVYALLLNLPEEMDHIFKSMAYIKDEDLTLFSVRERMLDEEKRMTENCKYDEKKVENVFQSVHQSDKNETVFKINNRQNAHQPFTNFNQRRNYALMNINSQSPSNSDSHFNYNVQCYTCKGFGHKSNFCANNTKNSNRRNSNSSNLANEYCFMFNKMKIADRTLIDSGSTKHLCAHSENFINIRDLDEAIPFTCANNSKMIAKSAGTVAGRALTTGRKFNLNNVHYVEGLTENLISVRQLTKMKNTVEFKDDNVFIYDSDGQLAITGHADETDQYVADITYNNLTNSVMSASDNSMLWHRRFGHAGNSRLTKMKTFFNEIKCDLSNCDSCIRAKMTKKTPSPPKTMIKTNTILQLVHTDLMGPFNDKSLNNNRYCLVFVDDWSRYGFVYFLKSKDEVKEYMLRFLNFMKNQVGLVKAIKSDNGLEFCNQAIHQIFVQHGINHERTAIYSPHQNGVAERRNRLLQESMRANLFQSNLPDQMWELAISYANYTTNRTYSTSIDNIPFFRWTGRLPSIRHLKPFGCLAYVYNEQHKNKIEERASSGIFVGYTETSRNSKILIKGKVIISNSVKVIEDVFPSQSSNSAKIESPQTKYQSSETNEKNKSDELMLLDDDYSDDSDDENNIYETTKINNSTSDVPRRSERKNKGVPARRDDYVYSMVPKKVMNNQTVTIPTTYDEAVESSFASEWMIAMENEYTAMINFDVFDLVDRMDGMNVIDSKWVFNVKNDPQKNEMIFKARLVARGFQQKKNSGWKEEIYAPTSNQHLLRLVLSIEVRKNLDVRHLDVSTAFLHSELNQPVYMSAPPGFSNSNKVWKLKKSIYGLRESPRVWNEHFSNILQKHLTKSRASPCIFYDDSMILLLYVDDILVIGPSTRIDNLIDYLQDHVSIKDLGSPKKFNGVNITKVNNSYILDQKDKIREVIVKYGLENARSMTSPMSSFNIEEDDIDYSLPVQELVGSLIYIAYNSRPDILASVQPVARKMNKPSKCVFRAAKNIVRYLIGTIDFHLTIGDHDDRNLTLYTDANFNETSTTGSLLLVHGNLITWSCNTQRTKSISSAAAELIAISDSVDTMAWILDLCSELNMIIDHKYILTDNQPAISMVKDLKMKHSKHLTIRAAFVNDFVKKRFVDVVYVESNEQLADILTKPINAANKSWRQLFHTGGNVSERCV